MVKILHLVVHFYFMFCIVYKCTLGAKTFADRNFRDFRVFWPFSRNFLPRNILNSKLAKVFACEITENSRLAKVFSIQFFQEFLALSGPPNDDESVGDSKWEEDIESESCVH